MNLLFIAWQSLRCLNIPINLPEKKTNPVLHWLTETIQLNPKQLAIVLTISICVLRNLTFYLAFCGGFLLFFTQALLAVCTL